MAIWGVGGGTHPVNRVNIQIASVARPLKVKLKAPWLPDPSWSVLSFHRARRGTHTRSRQTYFLTMT